MLPLSFGAHRYPAHLTTLFGSLDPHTARSHVGSLLSLSAPFWGLIEIEETLEEAHHYGVYQTNTASNR